MERAMASDGAHLLVLLLACCFLVPTLARNLDPSFVRSEGAKEAAGSAGLLVSNKQGPIASSAETGHAKGLHDTDTVPSLLDQNVLPIGLLPSSVESYSITDDGDFTVSLQKACYVKFDYEVYYAETITGKLTYGTITDLSGIQAKEAFFWVSVTGIRTDVPSSEYIYFDVGPISKKLSISQFQTMPTCKVKAFSALE